MIIKSKSLKIRNLPHTEKRVDFISSKPKYFLLFGIFLGLFLLLGKYSLLGILMIAFFAWYLFLVKDEIVVEFFSSYVFFYSCTDKDVCFICFYDDIKCFDIIKNHNCSDEILIVFKNEAEKRIPCLNVKRVRTNFSKHGLECHKICKAVQK